MEIIKRLRSDFLDFLKSPGSKKQEKVGKEKPSKSKIFKDFYIKNELWFIIFEFLIGIGFGMWGYYLKFEDQPHLQRDYFYLFITTIQLFVLTFVVKPPIPWPLMIAILYCPGILAYSTIRTVTVLVPEKVKIFFLQFKRGHVIVCGLNKRSMVIIKKLKRIDKKVVVIEEDKNNLLLQKCKEKGVLVLIGNCTDKYVLKDARVHRAKYLIAMKYDDTNNMEIGIKAFKILGKKYYDKVEKKNLSYFKKRSLKCFIHVKDLRLQKLYSNELLVKRTPFCELKIFNYYENCARILFTNYMFDEIIDTKTQGNQLHLAVIGFGEMGESVVLQAINQCHYANEEKLRITIIDQNIGELMKQFRFQYPAAHELFDLHTEQLDIKNLESISNTLISINRENPITAIIVCFNNKDLSIFCALTLPLVFKDFKIPVIVELEENKEIFDNFETYPITTFGIIKKSCSREIVLNEQLDLLSRANHELYRTKRIKELAEKGKTIEDVPIQQRESYYEWDELPLDKKNTNRQQIDHTFIKLRAIDYTCIHEDEKFPVKFEFKPEEIELLARMEHNRWKAERKLAGWTYSEYKDDVNKKSPYLIPFDDLPSDIKEFDYEFVENIPHLLSLVNTKIVRKN